jgi:hypothetical protein
MPDFYDHPDECLMNSTMENLKDTEGYEILLKHPGRCPSCQPWLDSKNYFLLGESSIMQKNYPSAKEFFIKAKETLPEHIDGDRSAYIKFLETRASSSNK